MINLIHFLIQFSDAMQYGQQLAAQQCALEHSHLLDSLQEGENLYMSSGVSDSAGAASVHAWCAEGLNEGLNHHTQVVWRVTTHVGCATVNGANCRVVVCRYQQR